MASIELGEAKARRMRCLWLAGACAVRGWQDLTGASNRKPNSACVFLVILVWGQLSLASHLEYSVVPWLISDHQKPSCWRNRMRRSQRQC